MKQSSPVPLRALRGMELFQGVPSKGLEEAEALARRRRLPPNSRIFRQGDPHARAHVVVEGSVRISQSGSDGAQIVVRFIAQGEMFGAIALFTDGRYPADAVTVTETLEMNWSESELVALMRDYPQIGINALRIVGRRLQETQDRVRELATQRAEQRVANAILRLAQQAGHDTSDGKAIEFQLRRKDIADISGTTIHTASRILTTWEREGFIASRKQRLTIRDTVAISRIADDPVNFTRTR